MSNHFPGGANRPATRSSRAPLRIWSKVLLFIMLVAGCNLLILAFSDNSLALDLTPNTDFGGY